MVVAAHDGIGGLGSHVNQTSGSFDCSHDGYPCRMGSVGSPHRRFRKLCKLRSYLARPRLFSFVKKRILTHISMTLSYY